VFGSARGGERGWCAFDGRAEVGLALLGSFSEDMRADVVPWLLVLALAAAAAVVTLLLMGRLPAAGVLAAIAVGASTLGGMWARRLVFADHAMERLVEAALFGGVAWWAIPESPDIAGAALAALVASYLASYLTAKATGLGFRVRERLPFRSVRPLVAALGLLIPSLLLPALLAAVVVSLEPVVRHGLSVARQREPA
jgi:hypothetical protein